VRGVLRAFVDDKVTARPGSEDGSFEFARATDAFVLLPSSCGLLTCSLPTPTFPFKGLPDEYSVL
jgi:hypothetical protein